MGVGPEALSCHILNPYDSKRRHSDKGIDMTLLPFTTYGEAAERMIQHNPLGLKRLAFVSSEDPDVIRAAQSLTTFGIQGASRSPLHSAQTAPLCGRPKKVIDCQPRHLVMHFRTIVISSLSTQFQVTVPVRAGTTPDNGWVIYTSKIPRENVGPHQQMDMFGRSRMSALWLLQLWLAVECDAWFGQRASNWNRMIDEARCVLVDKCDKTFVELSPPNEWNGYLVIRR
jgi:hypothetical protein